VGTAHSSGAPIVLQTMGKTLYKSYERYRLLRASDYYFCVK